MCTFSAIYTKICCYWNVAYLQRRKKRLSIPLIPSCSFKQCYSYEITIFKSALMSLLSSRNQRVASSFSEQYFIFHWFIELLYLEMFFHTNSNVQDKARHERKNAILCYVIFSGINNNICNKNKTRFVAEQLL